MSITSTEVNAMVYKYLVEAGFVHSSFAFAHESQVTRGFSDLSSVPPGTLIRLLQKGIQFAEMEANLKEDRSGIEEGYQVLNVEHILRHNQGDLRDIAQNQRAEREEESDGQELDHEPLERAPAVRQTQVAPRLLPSEQKPPKAAKRSKGRPALASQQHQSPSAEREFDHATQPALTHTGTDRLMLDQVQAAAQSSQAIDHASAELPNGHTQPAAKSASDLVPTFSPQTIVLDTRGRESRMCSWCPTAAVLATGQGDPEALLWSCDAGSSDTQMPTVLANSGGESDKCSVVECLDWSSDGDLLATGSLDGWIRVWNRSGQLLQTLREHQVPVTCLKFSRKTRLLLSGSVDRTAIVWQADTGLQMQRITAHSGVVSCVAWQDDTHFATANADVILLHSGNQACTGQLKGNCSDFTQLTWSPNGEFLVSCCEDGEMLVWSPSQQIRLHTLRQRSSAVNAIAWRPTASVSSNWSSSSHDMLVTSSQDQTVRVWDVNAGVQLLLISANSRVKSVAFHPSGNFLVTGNSDGDVCIFALPSGQKLHSASCSGGLTSVAWNFTGTTIAAAAGHQIHLLPLEYR